MASEAITLSPELRARGEKLYTARSGRPRFGEELVDELHRLRDGARAAQEARDAGAQHAVGFEALDQRRERVPEAVGRAQDHGLRLQAEVVEREHLDQLVERADSPGDRDEEVGGLGHLLLALGERFDDDQRAEVRGGVLGSHQVARHDPQHFAARGHRGPGRDAHQPAPASPVYEAQPAIGARRAELGGEPLRRGRQVFLGGAEQAHGARHRFENIPAGAIMRAFFSTPAADRMSGDSHQSLIKTPKQLVAVLVLAFVVPIVLIVLLSQLATSGRIADQKAMSPEEIAARIRPVAQVAVAGGAGGAKVLRTGEQIFQSVCTACHTAGVANAPKLGNKADWAARIRTGQKALVQVALKGKGAMPPRGGASDLTDLEVERAVVYMANAGGAKFKEPSAPAAAPQPAAAAPAQTAAASPAKAAPAAVADGKSVYES